LNLDNINRSERRRPHRLQVPAEQQLGHLAGAVIQDIRTTIRQYDTPPGGHTHAIRTLREPSATLPRLPRQRETATPLGLGRSRMRRRPISSHDIFNRYAPRSGDLRGGAAVEKSVRRAGRTIEDSERHHRRDLTRRVVPDPLAGRPFLRPHHPDSGLHALRPWPSDRGQRHRRAHDRLDEGALYGEAEFRSSPAGRSPLADGCSYPAMRSTASASATSFARSCRHGSRAWQTRSASHPRSVISDRPLPGSWSTSRPRGLSTTGSTASHFLARSPGIPDNRNPC